MTKQTKCDQCNGDIVKVRDSWLWIRDSKGYASVTTTFAMIAFWVTTFAYLISILERVGPVAVRSFDVAASSSYFGTCMMLYLGRRWTEAKYDNPTDGSVNKQ